VGDAPAPILHYIEVLLHQLHGVHWSIIPVQEPVLAVKEFSSFLSLLFELISALLRVEVRKRKFFVKTSKIRGISPPGRAGGRGKSKKQRTGRGRSKQFSLLINKLLQGLVQGGGVHFLTPRDMVVNEVYKNFYSIRGSMTECCLRRRREKR
jgi:hypothetical protein